MSEELRNELIKAKSLCLHYQEPFKILIDSALDKNSVNMHYTTGWWLVHFSIANNFTELTQMLIDEGIKCNILSEEEKNKLIICHYYEENIELKNLMDRIIKSSNINCANLNDWNLLHFSVSFSRKDLALFALNNKIMINFVNTDNYTPLMLAIYNNDLDFVKLLLDYGADVMSPNDKKNALVIANENHYDKILDLLLKKRNNKDLEDINEIFSKTLRM